MITALVPATPEEVKQAIDEIDTDFPEKFVIGNDETYQDACAVLKEVKVEQKSLTEKKKTILKPHDDARKAVMDLFREPEAKLADAERRLKAAITSYDMDRRRQQEQLERERSEEQRRLEAAAEEEAQVLREIGEDEAAEDLMLRVPTVPSVEISGAKVSGISGRESWKAEVVDFAALVDAVATGQADISLLAVNQVALNGLARALKANAKIPGVRIYADNSVAVRV